MNVYTVLLSPRAGRILGKLHEPHLSEILGGIETLRQYGPFPQGKNVVKLQGAQSRYRFRFGDYRIVYEVETRARVLTITDAGQKKDIVY